MRVIAVFLVALGSLPAFANPLDACMKAISDFTSNLAGPPRLSPQEVQATLKEIQALRGRETGVGFAKTPKGQAELEVLKKVVEYQDDLKQPIVYRAIAEELYNVGMRYKMKPEQARAMLMNFANRTSERDELMQKVFERVEQAVDNTKPDRFQQEAAQRYMLDEDFSLGLNQWQKRLDEEPLVVQASINSMLADPDTLLPAIKDYLPNPNWAVAFSRTTQNMVENAGDTAKRNAKKILIGAGVAGVIGGGVLLYLTPGGAPTVQEVTTPRRR